VEVILEAASLLPPSSGVAFDFVGDGQEAGLLERALARGPLPHVRWLRQWIPEDQLVADHVAAADVCLGIFASTPKAQDVVPAKVYLALACGRVVVTADSPAVREEILSRAAPGDQPLLVCPPGNPRALADALLSLRDDPALRLRLSTAARSLYHSHFRPERIVEPLVTALSS
jgi:glycosyltransferase involved in cell wall biosynthesis